MPHEHNLCKTVIKKGRSSAFALDMFLDFLLGYILFATNYKIISDYSDIS